MRIDGIIGWIKLSPKYLIPIAILAAALLFLPSDALSKFGVDDFVNEYRMWIGIVGLLTFALLLTHFMYWLKDIVTKKLRTARSLKAAKDSLRNLTPEEQIVLADYILRQTKSRTLRVQSGVAMSLEHAHIIYLASKLGTLMGGFAYNLQPWAWDELNAHPELLEPVLSEMKKQLRERKRKRY